MHADQRTVMIQGHFFGNTRYPVTTLYEIFFISQFFSHQFIKQVADFLCIHTGLFRNVRKTITWYGRNNQIKRKTVFVYLCESGNDFQKTNKRIRKTMDQQQWNRILTLTFLMNEMDTFHLYHT